MKTGISDNQDIVIRKGSSNDLDAMQKLFTETIEVICRKDYNDEQRRAWQSGIENKARWQSVLRDQYVLIAENNHTIAGFCTLDQGNYIDLLFVDKNEQDKGIASRLYTMIEEEALKQNQKQLTADVSKTARPFFEKKGFQVVNEQTVNVRGIDLINYKMIKNLV